MRYHQKKHTKFVTLRFQFDSQYYILSRLSAYDFLSPPDTFKSFKTNNKGDKSQEHKSAFYEPMQFHS